MALGFGLSRWIVVEKNRLPFEQRPHIKRVDVPGRIIVADVVSMEGLECG